MRGIVIAGTHSGCGKTTVTLGILAALKKKGLVVQPFKAGPDFIDSGLHGHVLNRPSRNLDIWMCGEKYVRECFRKHSADADIAVVEGVMGMYDGDFSTADLARLLQVPIVLVVDAYGMAESAGAVVRGFAECGVQSAECGVNSNSINFAGIIFNRVASDSHYKRLKDSVQGAPVLGYIPRDLGFEIPHRHLGLQTAEENPIARENIERLAGVVLEYVDLESLKSGLSECADTEHFSEPKCPIQNLKSTIRIAVAYDKAFCFYYEDNLDVLRAAGAEIVRFSPLSDSEIPAGVDAVYIGGGYPELHAGALSWNTSMRESINAWSDSGKPMYAECGGLMYLSRGIRDFDGNFFSMSGVFEFETLMIRKPKLAYREIVLKEDCILGTAGERLRGHEFHYSEIQDGEVRSAECGMRNEVKDMSRIFSVLDKKGISVPNEGFLTKNTLASYIHVHFGSNPRIVEQFAAFARGYTAV